MNLICEDETTFGNGEWGMGNEGWGMEDGCDKLNVDRDDPTMKLFSLESVRDAFAPTLGKVRFFRGEFRCIFSDRHKKTERRIISRNV